MKQINSVLITVMFAFLPALAAADEPAVSIHAEHQTPQAVFENLFHDMSLRVRPLDPKLWERIAKSPISIDLHDADFWDVMTQLDRSTGIRIARVQGDEVLVVPDHGQSARQPSVIVQPLRISVISVDAQSNIDFNRDIFKRDELRASMLVEADPRSHAISLEPADAEVTANRRGDRPANSTDFILGRATLKVNVAPNSDDGNGAIHTQYRLWSAEQLEPIEITIGAGRNSTQNNLGGFQCTIDVHPVGGGFGAEITLTRTTLDPQKWRAMAAAINASVPTLSDPAGNRFVINGGHNAVANKDLITRSIQFSDGGAQPGQLMNLAWNIPAKLNSRLIKIELNSVPLP